MIYTYKIAKIKIFKSDEHTIFKYLFPILTEKNLRPYNSWKNQNMLKWNKTIITCFF